MLEKMKDAMKQLELIQRLMKDEHARALLTHPKVQALFQDADFQQLIKTQDLPKLLTHPTLASLMHDPDIASLISKVNPQLLGEHGVA